MDNNLPEKRESTELAVSTNAFASYLRGFGLPTDNVIASSTERANVGATLPNFLNSLTDEEKHDARYLSKFVCASAVGLFDAALNYIWNEVVLNLRKKAIIYGIDMFYDSAVGGKNRANFKDESHLVELKDIVLLNTCLKIELISVITHKKLDHILTMRNDVAASHPNVESIGGFELLGWLQTCVKDVLQDRPSESAIRIRALVENLKASQNVIDEPSAARFSEEVRNLSLPHAQNLLITLFGIFVAPDTSQILRANIAKLSPFVWKCADDSVRLKIGTTIDGYRTNLEELKLAKGIEFLTLVNGRMYETLPAKTIALEELAEQLDDIHDAWDNFMNEPPIMREILRFCSKSSEIPPTVLPRLVTVVLRCRLGRGLSYREGVSPIGRPMYDKFFGILDDTGIIYCIISLYRPEINSKLTNSICQAHLAAVLNILYPLAISDRLKDCLDHLIGDIENAY